MSLLTLNELLRIFPRQTMNYTKDGLFGYTELFGKIAQRQTLIMKATNLRYVGFTKLGFVMALSLHLASFLHHIFGVVILCSKKQVIGIYTGAIVALMTNPKTVRNVAKGYLPRNAMSTTKFSVKTKVPVAAVVFASAPLPAFVRLADIHFRPELGMFGKIEHAGNLLYRLFATPSDVPTSRGQRDSNYITEERP